MHKHNSEWHINASIIRPSGAIRIAEWGNDRHRLPERNPDELQEIALEISLVRQTAQSSEPK